MKPGSTLSWLFRTTHLDPGFPSLRGWLWIFGTWYLLGKRNPLGTDDAFPILSFDGHIWSYVQADSWTAAAAIWQAQVKNWRDLPDAPLSLEVPGPEMG